MPITSIRLQNFRCFRQTKELRFAPLTVIFGRNNAGKSSIIHSLFLLRQTLDRPEGPRINLRGPLYHAGNYSDVVHQHRASTNIKLEFGVQASAQLVAFYARSRSPKERSTSRAPLVGKIGIEFASDEPQPPRLVRFQIEAGGREFEVCRGRGRGGPYEIRLDGHSTRTPMATQLFRSGILPYWLGSPGGDKDGELRDNARALIREFQVCLEKMRAVGAFRRAPERRYDYEGRAESIDLSGTSVISALIDDGLRRGKTRGNLLSSLNRWLGEVGSVKVMPLRRISPNVRLYEVRLKDLNSGRWANFADVGFGIGQALPVLVEGLRTTPAGVFIVQEPEIHLHQDAQLAMADFLIDLALSGRQVIVETHSEAILLRIRKAVVEASLGKPKGLKSTDVSILHVSATTDGTSRVKQLAVDDLGELSGWPKGFMDDVSKERLEYLKASAQVAEQADAE